ncbi:Uncharacterized protein OBRU01_01200 [Operophtera brumata]|uniref:Uncharacterized protein n=1 Tax=Operophtera brumata TaxID=104452 RepID=A0A0L7LUD2_OPEBR|nr:Uncharacterized protein OBRU01_01200 [Operophtera brumata]
MMEAHQVSCKFFFDETHTNRKKLFEEALKFAKSGKVLYIMCNELEELPQLSQELSSTNRQYMKMISFLYAKTLDSLLESLSTLPDWQNVPSAIILDELGAYCGKNSLHSASGIVALLLDSARSSAKLLKSPCILCISVSKDVVGEEYCSALNDLYFDC